MFQRAIVKDIEEFIGRNESLVQVIVGPRQVGKTTAARQLAEKLGWPTVFAAADVSPPPGPEWIESQWQLARMKARESSSPVLLVLDEIQKVRGWSETVKRLWDEESAFGTKVRPLLLGSSALLVQKGLTESLAGRFFLHRCGHWTWPECRQAFGWSLEQWLFFGGYPGAAPMIARESDWKRYVSDALVETVLARDVLQLQTIAKPALLRHLFGLAASLPAQIVSYNKMLGQLQDAGNTTTLAHYVRLLETAFLLSGLELHSPDLVRKRGSSPKLVLWNNALVTALSLKSYSDFEADPAWRGRLVENAVGAHLLSGLNGPEWSLSYWRSASMEVDYIVRHGQDVWAIEVKSGRSGRKAGLEYFKKQYPKARILIVGAEGIPLEEFFSYPAIQWFL